MAGDRDRAEGGEFTSTIALADVRGVFNAVRGPVITTRDVVDELDCSRESARQKLLTLHEQEQIARRKTAQQVVWWRIDDTNDPETELRRLSRELAEPIVIGDQVFEDGDKHPLDIGEASDE